MPLLDKIAGVFSGSLGDAVEKIGNVADKFITTSAEKEAFKLEIQKELNRHDEDVLNKTSELIQAEFADTASARQMNVQIQASENASWLAKNASHLLAVFTVLLTFSLWGVVLFRDSAVRDNKEIVFAVLGSLSTIVMMVFSYYFGSSAGSKRNADSIRNIAEKSTDK